jgi:hypothetical protein
MQHTHSFNRGLFRDSTAAIVEGQEPVMNNASSLTAPSSPYKFHFSCECDGGLSRNRLDESADDFFGTEDLLSQVYEDSVHFEMVAG